MSRLIAYLAVSHSTMHIYSTRCPHWKRHIRLLYIAVLWFGSLTSAEFFAGVTAQQIYSPGDCAAFISCFRELQIGEDKPQSPRHKNSAAPRLKSQRVCLLLRPGLVVYGVAITKQRVSATVLTLLGTVLVKAIANVVSSS